MIFNFSVDVTIFIIIIIIIIVIIIIFFIALGTSFPKAKKLIKEIIML